MEAVPPVHGTSGVCVVRSRSATCAEKLSLVAGLRSLTGTGARVADLVMLTLALIAAALPGRMHYRLHSFGSFFTVRVPVQDVLLLLACWAAWASLLHLAGLYHSARGRSLPNLLLRLYTGVGGCSVVMLAMAHVQRAAHSTIQPLLLFFAGALILTCLGRIALASYELLLRPRFRHSSRAIIVGTDSRAEELACKLSRDRSFAYDIVGFVGAERVAHTSVAGRPILGTIADLSALLMQEHIDEVLVALPLSRCYAEIRQVQMLCEESGVRSQYFSDVFATSLAKSRAAEGDSDERVVLHMVHNDVRLLLKRTFDFVGAALGLLVLSPVLFVVGMLIRLGSPGPIFFSQVRYGLNKRRFAMYKFRSMVPDAEARQATLEHMNEAGGPIFKIKHDPRVTRIGRLLRKTSLDELPQLWNVLRGDMSLVGPRPLPMRDVGRFSDLHLVRRFSVKPGMTGLWQVSGRSETSFDGWIKLDLFYIDHWSLMMDAHILLRTLPAVLRGSGAS